MGGCTSATNYNVPPVLSPSGYCHSIGLDCAAKVIDPDAVQMTTYGYAHAAGVLPGGAHMDDGPVAERLPHMMPAIGQYYFSMPWVVQVGVLQAGSGGSGTGGKRRRESAREAHGGRSERKQAKEGKDRVPRNRAVPLLYALGRAVVCPNLGGQTHL